MDYLTLNVLIMFDISIFSNPWAKESDEALVLATKRGNSSAFEILYDRRHKKIYNYLWNLLNYSYDDTVSLTSDVFIKFYEYIKIREIENVKAILYRIAHNAAIDCMRTNQSQYQYNIDDLKMEQMPDKDTHKHEFNSEYKNKLFQELLKCLEEQQREVLYLYYQEDKSYDEIAMIIGSNKNTVGTIIFNAKKKLNEMAVKYGIKHELL